MFGQPYRISKRSGTNGYILERDYKCLRCTTQVVLTIDIPKVAPLCNVQFPIDIFRKASKIGAINAPFPTP